MTIANAEAEADTARLRKIAADAKAPDWLREAVALLAEGAAAIPPLKDDRRALPEFIYRH